MMNANPTGSLLRGSNTGAPRMQQPKIEGYQSGQFQNFDPQQMGLYQNLFKQFGPESYLSRLSKGDKSLFGEIEEPALEQFSQLQGGLQSRFGGAQGEGWSSAMQNKRTSAGMDFAKQLQSNRMGLQQQATKDLWQMAQQLLGQKSFEQFITPEKQKEMGFWKQAGIAGAEGLGMGLGMLPGLFI